MSTVVAAVAGLGLLLLFDGMTGPDRRARSRPLRALDRLSEEAGFPAMNAFRLLAACLGALLAAGFVVAGVTGSPVVASVFAVGAGWMPYAFLSGRRRSRRRRFREAWPDAIATLVSSVRAGVSLQEGTCSLATRGPEDLRSGFASLASTYRATGSFRAALERLRAELADPVADRVVAALALAHEVGGSDLVRVLRALGDFVRDDLRVRKEIEARWSWTVTAARVAVAAPWVVLLLMSTRPEAAVAYNSPGGAAVIAGGGIATLFGYRLMLRVAKLPEERRLGG